MTRPAITVRAHDALGVAARSMAKNGIKRLPVVDEAGKLVGVLSRVDVLQLVTGKEARKISAPKGAAKILQDVMSPHFPVVGYNEGWRRSWTRSSNVAVTVLSSWISTARQLG